MVETTPVPSPAPSTVMDTAVSGENDTIMTGPALAPGSPEPVKEEKPTITPTSSDESHDVSNPSKKTAGSYTPVLKLPGTMRRLWNEFRKKGVEMSPDADGFVLIDRTQFISPEKLREKTEKSRAIWNSFTEKLPPRFRNVSFGMGAAVLLSMFLLLIVSTPLMRGAFSARDGFFDNAFTNWDIDYNVAFIGNSYLYVNDVPRLMETISEGHISQNSVINTAGSLGKLLRAGNGMNERWRTDDAILRTGLNNYYNFIDEDYVFYDFGACTVYQLLEGYDNDLVYQNYNNAYYDDGTNPCFQDEYYLGLVADRINSQQIYWDFVVLNDQTKRMAFDDARSETIDALKYAYAPMIRDARAIPIIVDTHAFWTESGNMTGLGDVAYFTAEVYEGLREYVLALKYNLPDRLNPKVAKVGLAYLTVYEENQDMWESLFLSDQVHSSPAGSYLFANVLYATIYGHMPHSAQALGGVQSLFEGGRDVQDQGGYPTNREANYLRNVARKVVLRGYVPKILSVYSETNFELRNSLVLDNDEMQYYWNGYDNSVLWDEDQADVSTQRYTYDGSDDDNME